MKKVALIIAAVGFMAAGNFSFGQTDNEGPKKEKLSPVELAEKKTERMTEDLKLTAEQADEIRQINLYHIQEMASIKEEMKALKKKAKAKKEAHKKAVNEVLTEEQRKLHEEKMAERREKREERRKKRCEGGER